MNESLSVNAVAGLRSAFAKLKESRFWNEIVLSKDIVIGKFGPIFKLDNARNITDEQFRAFLSFDQNKHWTGLHRQNNRILADLKAFHTAMAGLLDESRPIDQRLDLVSNSINGFGKGILTAILTVAHPDRYGVWNRTAEAALNKLGLMPVFSRGMSFGKRYVAINKVLTQARDVLGIDFWTLDTVWWMLVSEDSAGEVLESSHENVVTPMRDQVLPAEFPMGFALERHLHNFLWDNWKSTSLANEWALYTEPGEPDLGYEYSTPVGRIDILARHRSQNKWLVIELKRHNATDVAVGQAARYMGWVREHLAEPGDEVHGMIISQAVDQAMHYAVASVPNLSYQIYEFEFRLRMPSRS